MIWEVVVGAVGGAAGIGLGRALRARRSPPRPVARAVVDALKAATATPVISDSVSVQSAGVLVDVDKGSTVPFRFVSLHGTSIRCVIGQSLLGTGKVSKDQTVVVAWNANLRGHTFLSYVVSCEQDADGRQTVELSRPWTLADTQVPFAYGSRGVAAQLCVALDVDGAQHTTEVVELSLVGMGLRMTGPAPPELMIGQEVGVSVQGQGFRMDRSGLVQSYDDGVCSLVFHLLGAASALAGEEGYIRFLRDHAGRVRSPEAAE